MPSVTEASGRSSTHRILAADGRAHVLEVVREAAGPVGVAEVAERVGLHVNTVRGHLELLADTGFVTRQTERRTTPGRPRVLYSTTGRPVPDDSTARDAANYRILARVLVEQIKAHARDGQDAREIARRAGETWAAATADLVPQGRVADVDGAYRVLVGMLEDLGFDPHPEPAHDRVVLHACPYLDSPRSDLPVVCGVHQGLIQGTLTRLSAPLAAAGLDVRPSPTRCVVRLERLADGSPADGG